MDKLTPEEFAHAASITDKNPTLEPLPAERVVRILIGSVIRKPPIVVEALLKTLRWQQTRTRCEIDFSFVLNFASEDSFAADTKALLLRARTFQTRIRRNIRLAEAPSFGKSIFHYAPGSHGAADYQQLAREVAGL